MVSIEGDATFSFTKLKKEKKNVSFGCTKAITPFTYANVTTQMIQLDRYLKNWATKWIINFTHEFSFYFISFNISRSSPCNNHNEMHFRCACVNCAYFTHLLLIYLHLCLCAVNANIGILWDITPTTVCLTQRP